MKPIPLFSQSIKPTKKNRSVEKSTQVAISTYLKTQYKDVIFFSDASGVRLTMGQSVTLKRMRSNNCNIPDMIILEPKGKFCGLLLEVKSDKYSPYLKNGELSSNKHIQNQVDSLEKLKGKGYACFFAVGIENAKQIIDNYMNL